ncbi:hypothetical protein KTO58_19765 [Chitinophaga pendula]|uniref:DUF2586 family protein n=1 Tax=Chitinophaga TaxID=79328 RepID=UPI000BB0C08D|nr:MULTISPECIES: DUF2586 family protein [Chitinophaga]ASZ14873.1 hypothetical protein CK934_09035 [Chitinophaga sp. MD30]UCJ05908.1 hypothetical protein KTO58_19765 [Chitinophaga pendula]
MLPRIKIIYENGAIGAAVPSPDGLLGIVCTAVAVPDKFSLVTPYLLRSFDGLSLLGITVANNPALHKLLREFYAEAGDGTEVWIYGVPNTVNMTDMLDVTKANARALMEAARGNLRGLIVSYLPAEGYTPVIVDGLDGDVYTAMAKGQELAKWSAETKYAPVFVIIEGRGYSGSVIALKDLSTAANNSVGILIGDTVKNSGGAAMGLLAGRIAKVPVHRNIGRVRDGAIATTTAFIKDTIVELADIESIHNKGYITLRSYAGRSGYFFTDDPLATGPTDDYKYLARRRTIDKAYRIAYDTLLEELLSEIPVTDSGQLQPIIVKTWQGRVERAIATAMTANGELSADVTDPNDRGVICVIDEQQNVVSTSRIVVQLRVRPFGYARYVDVLLGFTTTNV